MERPSGEEVTALLKEWSAGDRSALERLMPLVYGELHKLAASHLRSERGDHTLQPTALVHEAFLRLVGQRSVSWASRAHFYGIAAQMMRRILVDHARRRLAAKRSPGTLFLDLGEKAAGAVPDRAPELLALDRALTELERLDPRQAKVVELRFFAGLSVEETAEVAGVSTATVKREWRTARAFLRHEIGVDAAPGA
jgi:RNA polymerase sigma factor (TIGR02999 family)